MQEPRIEGIEEIVIAVKDADKAAAYFKDLFGIDFSYGWEIGREKIRVRSEVIAGTQLQFIEATDPESVVAKFIKAKGEGLNHFAFRVSNLDEMVRRLKGKGVKFIPDKIVEVDVAGKNMPIEEGKAKFIFVHPTSAYGVLIELIEVA